MLFMQSLLFIYIYKKAYSPLDDLTLGPIAKTLTSYYFHG